MENEVTVYDQTHDITISKEPEIILEEAKKAAKALTKVIDGRKKKLILNNKTYLFNEDWQTVGKFYGVTAKVISTEYVNYGDVIGFEAKAVAIRADGLEISGAEAMCLNDETNWKNKPLFQLKSMAQTRACSKVLKNVLAWVVVLAGYQPTPAEEMTGNEHKTTKPTTGKKQLTPEQQKLWAALVLHCGNDPEKIKATLKEMTSFTVSSGKDKGKEVQGKDSIYDVSDKQAQTVRHQLEKIQKEKGESGSGLDAPEKCQICAKMDTCELNPDPECGSYEPLERTQTEAF
jgi:hypothetical protein